MKTILKLMAYTVASLLAFPVVVVLLSALTAVAVVFLVLLSPVVLLALFGSFCFGLARFFPGGRKKRDTDLNREEVRIMQEIHGGLSRMERRIESLETILFDRAAPRGYGNAGKAFN
jgi:hypothetical protein